jgi:hypothetical protein
MQDQRALSALGSRIDNYSVNKDGRIVSLVLRAGPLTVESVAPVAQLECLRELSLDGCRLSNDCLVELRNLQGLRAISLQWTNVGNTDLLMLRNNHKHLTHLILNHTNVDDSCVDIIQGFENLSDLFISDTHITEERYRDLVRKRNRLNVQYQ